jgi:hypothetical protein
VAELDGFHRAADEGWTDASDDGFDFGKFGHVLGLRNGSRLQHRGTEITEATEKGFDGIRSKQHKYSKPFSVLSVSSVSLC